MSMYPGVTEFCQQLYDKMIRSPFLLGFMVELDEERLKSEQGDKAKLLEHALEVGGYSFGNDVCIDFIDNELCRLY